MLMGSTISIDSGYIYFGHSVIPGKHPVSAWLTSGCEGKPERLLVVTDLIR